MRNLVGNCAQKKDDQASNFVKMLYAIHLHLRDGRWDPSRTLRMFLRAGSVLDRRLFVRIGLFHDDMLGYDRVLETAII